MRLNQIVEYAASGPGFGPGKPVGGRSQSSQIIPDLNAGVDHTPARDPESWASWWWKKFKLGLKKEPPRRHGGFPDWVWDIYAGDLPGTPEEGEPVKAAIMAMPDYPAVNAKWRAITGYDIIQMGDE